MSDFDLPGAQKAGYSDSAIADHLAVQNNFDIAGARKAGYSDAEILAHLGTAAPAPQASGYEVAPDISATGAPANGEDPLSVAAQVPQHITNALYKTISAPGDLIAMGLQAAGLRDKNAPSPSEGNRGAIGRMLGSDLSVDKPADTPAKKAAAMVGDTLGEVASTAVPFGFGAKLAKGATVGKGVAEAMAAKPAAQVALTGAGNAAAPAIQSSDLPEFIKPYAQMAVPFALGGVTHMGQRAFSAAPAATTQEAERRALLDYGKSIGGTNTAGKIMNSEKMQTLESANSKLPLPFVGGRVARTEEANRNAFQTEALRKAGDTTGATAAPPNVTQEVRSKLGDKFNFLTNGIDMKIGPEFGSDLAKARGALSDQLESQIPKDVKTQLNELQTAADALKTEPLPRPPTPSADKYPSTDVGPYLGEQPKPNPQPNVVTLEARKYQNIRSKLSAMLNGAHGNDKQAIGGMIDALDNVAERNMPKENFQDLKDVRQQWRNLLAVEKAVGSANNPQTAAGNIPTAAYMRASKGNPDIEKLGRYGGMFVGDKVPNSGTASRMGVTHLAGALAGAYEGMQHAPGATMGAIGAGTIPFAFEGAMNNPVTRAWLMRRLQNPSQSVIGGPTFGALAGQQALKQGQ